MNKKAIRWLYGELPRLVEQGVLTPDADAKLRAHYGVVEEARPARLAVIIFGVLGADSNGFATVERLEREAPAGGTALPIQVNWTEEKNGQVHIAWTGLDRFYMTEKKAPAAEEAYRAHNRGANRSCHVTVRVGGGRAVIENLFIEDKPIREWLK